MSRWYPLKPTDDAFLSSAVVRTVKVLDVPVPAEKLWAALAADDAVVSWGAGATRVAWIGDRPFGVGTIREVTIGGVVTVREKFYRWDEGTRMSFSVSESTRPGIVKFAEDYVVEATPTGSKLTWTVAFEPARLTKILGPVATPGLSAAIGTMVRGLRKKLLAATPV